MAKKIKLKTCKAKGCRTKFTQRNSFHVACSPPCAVKIDEAKKAKKEKEERKRIKKRLEELEPLGYWLGKAQTACNKYIRERDKYQPCISCGRWHTGQYEAGHYKSVGARSELRFHPANIHKQCHPCNHHKSANLILYRQALVEKVGEEMVGYLENYNGIQKMTVDEVKEIEAHYKELYKELANGVEAWK